MGLISNDSEAKISARSRNLPATIALTTKDRGFSNGGNQNRFKTYQRSKTNDMLSKSM